MTEPFIVKDRRGEGSEKHDIPLLNDDVWRLNKISKNGASHVAFKGSGILVVKDFLRLYYKDEQALRKILIKAKESVWATIVEHAKKCCPGTELYSFVVEGKSVMLFFNSVCQIVGAKFGDNYSSFDDLEKHKKEMVVKWSKVAHKDMTYDQHDYEMDNGKPRPINQEMLHGLSIVEHECTEASGNVCLPDNQLVASGSHSKQHESVRLESEGVAQNHEKQHRDRMVQEALQQQQHLFELEEEAAWLQEQQGQDDPEQEHLFELEEQEHPDEEEQEAALLEEQQHLGELEEVAARLQEQDQDEPEQEQMDQETLEQAVAWLRTENARLTACAMNINAECSRVEENWVLRAGATELGNRLQSVNDVFRVVDEFSSADMEIKEEPEEENQQLDEC